MSRTNLGMDIRVDLHIKEHAFRVYADNANIVVEEKENGNCIATYAMHEVPMDHVAHDLPGKILEIIARPHMAFESEKSLLKFYLNLMNVVNMFYLQEFTESES